MLRLIRLPTAPRELDQRPIGFHEALCERSLTRSYARYDDLIEEESENVQAALKRLAPRETYDRVFRLRRAIMCDYQHKLLPKDQWTKPEEVPSTDPPRLMHRG